MLKKIVSKKITKAISAPLKEEEKVVPDSQETAFVQVKKKCMFCKTETKPIYTDTQTLRRFVNDRAKIVPKLRTGSCSKHQRLITEQVKYARHLALLPFTPKI